MLGNAHRPENANRLGFGNHVRDSSQRLLRQSRDPRSGFDGEGLETGSVLLEAVYLHPETWNGQALRPADSD